MVRVGNLVRAHCQPQAAADGAGQPEQAGCSSPVGRRTGRQEASAVQRQVSKVLIPPSAAAAPCRLGVPTEIAHHGDV